MSAAIRPLIDNGCPACHHPDHDPGACELCPRCEIHTDEALDWIMRVHPELLARRRPTFAESKALYDAGWRAGREFSE